MNESPLVVVTSGALLRAASACARCLEALARCVETVRLRASNLASGVGTVLQDLRGDELSAQRPQLFAASRRSSQLHSTAHDRQEAAERKKATGQSSRPEKIVKSPFTRSFAPRTAWALSPGTCTVCQCSAYRDACCAASRRPDHRNTQSARQSARVASEWLLAGRTMIR